MPRETLGLLLGFVGVCIFAGTLPFTHIAVEHLSPLFVTTGRAALAGVLALATLLVLKRPRPSMRQVGTLAGAALVIGFTLHEGGGSLGQGDVFLLAAALSSALGYVLSGKLVRSSFAGWEVISWVLVVALPATIPLTLLSMPQDPASVPAWSWTGFLYVALMSQYLGFFAWNAGLAIGGIAHVSQVQLLQTFITLVIASFLNRETIHAAAWAVAGAVLLLVLAANRARVSQAKL